MTPWKTAVVDYGMGNLFSVVKALQAAGHDARLVRTPAEADGATHMVVPGVGAFGEGMSHLSERGFVRFIRDWAESGRPLLGICLGLQLLFEESEEFGRHEGLKLLPGKVVGFSPDRVKVPHVGWNQVLRTKDSFLWDGLPESIDVYFVHSFHAEECPQEIVLGVTEYGVTFPSIVGHDGIVGVQFHPEKSQDLGIALLRNFGKATYASVSRN